jgi:hypothetical protein
MSKGPNDKTQHSMPNTDAESSVESKKPTDPTTAKETAADIFRKLTAGNPRFVEVKNTGQGYMFVGWPPTRRSDGGNNGSSKQS